MNAILLKLKTRYLHLSKREKAMVFGLCTVIWYVIYQLIIMDTLKTKIATTQKNLAENKEKVIIYNKQAVILQAALQSNAYKALRREMQALHASQNKYKHLVTDNIDKQSEIILKTLLLMKNQPEGIDIRINPISSYKIQAKNEPNDTTKKDEKEKTLLQKPFAISFIANYNDTYYYIKQLEQQFPFVQWNQFSYDVVSYPKAKIEMEFSILYEKNS